MDILLTGGTGQVATALRALSWDKDNVLHAPTRSALDLADPVAVTRYLDGRPVDAILSVGAYTAVDRAENDQTEAWAVNALAPGILAAHAARAGIPIIHVSTDYVFDGSKAVPYLETDPVNPVSVYGASKEAGEQAVRASGARHVILRTSWVVSPDGSNFIRTMLRLGAERPLLRVVDDQWGAPTAAADLAQAIQAILTRLRSDPDAPTGTYHFCNTGETTWYGFARHIFACAQEQGVSGPRVEPVTTAEYPTPASRPANARLDTGRIRRDFGIRPRPWQEATREVVQSLLADTTAKRSVP